MKKIFYLILVICAGLATTISLTIVFSQISYIIESSGAVSLEGTSSPVFLSVISATIASLMALLIAIPTSYLLARHTFPGKGLINGLLDVPIFLSPVAVGIAILLFFRGSAGAWIESHIITFIFRFPGIVLSQFVLALAISVRVMKASFEEIDPRYEYIARTLGCDSLRAFLRVTLPLSKPGMLAAFVLSWGRCFGDFGATAMVGGAIPGKTETIPVSIYMRLSEINLSGAVTLSLLLTLVALIIIFIVRLIGMEK